MNNDDVKRNPLRDRAKLIGLLTLVAQAGLLFGIDLNQWVELGMLIITGAAMLGLVITTESEVTPLSDPRDNEGNPLVSVGDLNTLARANPPAPTARKSEWVNYAVALGWDRQYADSLTKDEIIMAIEIDATEKAAYGEEAA